MAEGDGGEAAVEALAGTDRRLELPAIVVRAVGLIARPAGDQAGVVAARVADLRGDAVADRIALRRTGRYLADLVVGAVRSEEHTSELQALMRISYAGFCWTKTTVQQMTH